MRLRTLFPNGSGCKGFRTNGQPCTAIEVYENGLCKVHGGQGAPGQWFEIKKAALLKKTARFIRRGQRHGS